MKKKKVLARIFKEVHVFDPMLDKDIKVKKVEVEGEKLSEVEKVFDRKWKKE